MLIPLKDIELYFDDNLIEQAEKLKGEGCVRSIREVDKNLWVAYIEKGELFETEVILSQQKIKAFTCECADFKKKHVCAHSLCMLLALREHKTAHQFKSADHKKYGKRISEKDNLKDILRAAPSDELINFIVDYAKKDAKLTLLLKSKFISVKGFEDPALVYKNLIQQAAKNLYLPHAAAGNQAALHLKSVFLQLLKNAESEIRNGDLTQSFNIVSAVYDELLKLHTRQIFPQLYAPLVTKVCTFLTGLYEATDSSDLKTAIWELCFPLKSQFLYHFQCIEEFFTKLILPLSHFLHKEDILLSELDQQLELYQRFPELKNQLVIFKMMVAFQIGNAALTDKMLEAHAESVSLLLYSARKANENGQSELAAGLLKKALQKNVTEEQKTEMEEMLFRIALVSGDLPALYVYGHKRLISTLDATYYKTMKEHQCGRAFLDGIIQELEGLPAVKSKNHCLATIYALEDQREKLLDLVKSLQSLDLLMLYDALLPISEDDLLQLYQQFIRHYLYHHIGRQASHRIVLVITHLRGTAKLSIAKAILAMLILEYPERHTLMEELQNLA